MFEMFGFHLKKMRLFLIKVKIVLI